MTRIVETLRAIMSRRPPPIESTKIELDHEIVERSKIRVRTAKLAHMLADYRRQDGLLK